MSTDTSIEFIFMYLMILFVLIQFGMQHLTDFVILLDADLIVFALLCYTMQRPSLLLLLFFGVFKDLWLWDQFYGISTLQYVVAYAFLEQTKYLYAKQTFYVTWLHFIVLNSLYQIIPVIYFYIKSGALLYQFALWHCVSNIFWFPIFHSLLYNTTSNKSMRVEAGYER